MLSLQVTDFQVQQTDHPLASVCVHIQPPVANPRHPSLSLIIVSKFEHISAHELHVNMFLTWLNDDSVFSFTAITYNSSAHQVHILAIRYTGDDVHALSFEIALHTEIILNMHNRIEPLVFYVI